MIRDHFIEMGADGRIILKWLRDSQLIGGWGGSRISLDVAVKVKVLSLPGTES
jgi:hypothetical protein